MLRNLLTPIRARFDLSPRSTSFPVPPHSPRSAHPHSPVSGGAYGQNEDAALEDFARDVMMELMRNAVEGLKAVQPTAANDHGVESKNKTDLLAEIHRIMVQDPRTKDVFRELDGFLVLMTLLSTVHEEYHLTSPPNHYQHQQPQETTPNSAGSQVVVLVDAPASDGEDDRHQEGEGEEVWVDAVVESTSRLVFMVLSEAMYRHPQNAEYFCTRVGFEFLAHATLGLLSDPQTTTETLGLLLSLALHDFTSSSFFTHLRNAYNRSKTEPHPDLTRTRQTTFDDRYVTTLKYATIHCPGALLVLWNAVASLATDDAACMRCAMFKVLEMVSHVRHRNHAMLCTLGLVGPVVRRFFRSEPSGQVGKEREEREGEEERHLLQKLLRRLLEMGAETGEVRRMFERSLRRVGGSGGDGGEDGDGEWRLDMEVLDLLKVGMKSRWVDHFSVHGRHSSLVLREEGLRGLPSSGFTFMMWLWMEELPRNGPCQLFGIKLDFGSLVELVLNEDGTLGLLTSSTPNTSINTNANTTPSGSFARLGRSKIVKGRWTHITLVHYPHKSFSPTIRVFIDGVLCDTLNWPYPKPENVAGPGQYIIGDEDLGADHPPLNTSSNSNSNPKPSTRDVSWCISSAYLLSTPLADELARLIYYLGPRYSGTFQDSRLIKFLTYEASTALNVVLANGGGVDRRGSGRSAKPRSPSSPSSQSSSLMVGMGAGLGGGEGTRPESATLAKVLRDGLGVSEAQIVFAVSARCAGMVRMRRMGKSGVLTEGVDSGLGAGTVGMGVAGGVVVRSVPLMAPLEGEGLSESGSGRIGGSFGGDDDDNDGEGVGGGGRRHRFKVRGDVVLVRAMCLDQALWNIGGPAVALKLVHAANAPHELSRTLGVLLDGLKNSWQNSEDMERLRGYDILAGILRTKTHLINLTSFETIFEFLGVNFNSPEQSTIVNIVAYCSIALDFDLWSHARKEIQQAHLEHFTTLLAQSWYKKFNARQRLGKLGLVRRLLFVLQMDWYQGEPVRWVVEALRSACQANFSRDEAIKPVVSYLAANLHGDSVPAGSPQSILTRVDIRDTQKKAEQVLISFVSILSIPNYHSRFTTTLPLPRICLLLLGEKPSSVVVEQVLHLIGISIGMSSSFVRKFELVSGWSVLKAVVPGSWDVKVHRAAFDVLVGHTLVAKTGVRSAREGRGGGDASLCTHMVPTILASLQARLGPVAERCQLVYNPEDDQDVWALETTMEMLVEELMSLHTSNQAFRRVFASQQTTQLFVNTYKSFVSSLAGAPAVNNQLTIRLLEKLTHFGLALALDNAVAGTFKREILDSVESAEMVISPSAGKPTIDRSLVSDNRSVRQRVVSGKFSMQVGERVVTKTMMRTAEWRRVVKESEKKRLRKNIQDLREYRRQVPRLQEWTQSLTSERSLWPQPQRRMWRLDETEGPHRIRKKLEPASDDAPSSRVDANEGDPRQVEVPEVESKSTDQVEVPPWAESYEISTTEIEERQLSEEIVEDKLRRVRHELEPSDVIEAVQTVARIAGVDSSPGLLIIGKTHIYMLDGLVENDEGEVIDAHEAPKRLFFVPGSIVELDGPQRAQRWSHSQIAGFSDKRFLFRDVALELYFKDSRSLLIVFLDQKRRSEIDQRLTGIIARHSPEQLISPGILKSPLFGKMGQMMFSGFKSDELASAQRKWQTREISNFTYLSILNQISGRTPSDATQYPIFPWVLRDYTSQTLDLTLSDTYRNLTMPMGALTPERREAAEMRYMSLKSVDEEPFHYGTHFSSSMIVCHFLIRLAPFTNMFKTLQGGDWDLPDRLFSDLGRAYQSAATDVRGDVRELIPEFFTCPEFLENSANHDFGVLSSTGERIHDVKLPPWARQDPLLFVTLNRRALESPHVSECLPQWIDLIWGFKQRDPESFNAFHPLSYEGSIDLDSIQDDLEREATVGIIHNFGQTPRRLFSTPHPLRYNYGLSSLPIGTLHGVEEDPHLLVQAPRCFKDLGRDVPVCDFVPDAFGEKLVPCPPNTLHVPLHTQETIEWIHGTSELRVHVDHKLVQVAENAFCTCAAFADPTNLVTGSGDYMVRMWKVTRGQQSHQTRVNLTHIMRIHTDEVVCVTASRTWSVVLSGSRDGSAALWDLNRGVYIRSFWHGEAGGATAVKLVAINESTGYIATCSQSRLCLHTINARHITTLDLVSPPVYSTVSAPILSMAFHERDYSQLGILATGGSDGTITLRTWTADGTPEGEKAQWEFVTVRTMKVRTLAKGAGKPSAVTSLRFLGESLIHGEESGKSFVWNLPD
ncbi:hypothetical protein AX17_003946 [Amanita inopinata Kibby_2008]|nr:hypothetical protein AX17_003946 [Amanita inopinata Kibby_2008]